MLKKMCGGGGQPYSLESSSFIQTSFFHTYIQNIQTQFVKQGSKNIIFSLFFYLLEPRTCQELSFIKKSSVSKNYGQKHTFTFVLSSHSIYLPLFLFRLLWLSYIYMKNGRRENVYEVSNTCVLPQAKHYCCQ